MARVGLVLGGGGITGGAFHFGALFALRLATGWNPETADVMIGTSSGAVVAAITRSGHLELDPLIGDVADDDEFAEALGSLIYRRGKVRGVGRWIRHGLVPGIRRPGVRLSLGAPAPYTTDGIQAWVRHALGDSAGGWPELPTIVVSYEIEGHRRVAFGTVESPDTDLATAVAASAAVPVLFNPVTIHGKRYVDGGVASGTNADLVLGHETPLDLIIVSAPMASLTEREDARFYEGVFDRYGGAALTAELAAIEDAWPDADIIVLRPDAEVLAETRPNPLSTAAAIPAFLQTLHSMRAVLSSDEVWPILQRHLVGTRRRLPFGRRLRTSRVGD
jgi:NTE family protein